MPVRLGSTVANWPVRQIPARTGALTILVDHDMSLVSGCCETTAVLDFGELIASGPTAQVLRDGTFAHDLILEATRRSVPVPIAQLLHRRIAANLLAHHALPDSIAPHWAGAAEWREAGVAYAAAARRARGERGGMRADGPAEGVR